MPLDVLTLVNFKNHAHTVLHTNADVVCFVGQNGAGKTNILEAIYLLCLTKARSGLLDKELVKHSEGFYRVQGRFLPQNAKVSIKYEVGKRKAIDMDGKPQSKMSEYIGQFPVVMISPDDTELATGGSEERRKLIDATLSQVNRPYLEAIARYQKILEQRNQFIKQSSRAGIQPDTHLLDVFNGQLSPLGKLIHEQRAQFVIEYKPLVAQFYAEISGGKEAVSLNYESKLEHRDYLELLEESLSKDLALERTTEGVHKDDLSLIMDDVSVKRFGSQGQLKSFILSLRLAQYEYLRRKKSGQCAPILLLDDIFDKLDANRVKHLIQLLLRHGFGQIFITDTHFSRVRDLLEGVDVQHLVFKVENGVVLA